MPGRTGPPGPQPQAIEVLGGDLPVANAFLLEVKDVSIGVFREVAGLKVSLELQEIVEGGQNSFIHQFPGRMTWEPLVFKRGLTNNDALYEWFMKASGEGFAAKGNKLERPQSASVTAMAMDGTFLRAWELIEPFPVRWSGPDFGTDKIQALEEELEIRHHGFRSHTHGVRK